jgi:hypothetical protein
MDMTHHQAQEIAHFDRLLALSHDLDELDKEIISRRDRGEYEGSFALQLDRAIKESKMYFEKYGKGYEPDKVLMVNKKRYDN